MYDASEIKDEKLRKGSLSLQRMFENYFNSRGLPTDTTAFDGRSDYAAFMENGIASGGIFTGADAIKTPEQAKKYGGISGIPLDPCYHQDCDRVVQIKGPGMVIMKQNMKALGHVLEKFVTTEYLDTILYT